MIGMHGTTTWYKGPQLAHHHTHHSDYHQFRSYPSFVVAPYQHESTTAIPTSAVGALTTLTASPLFVEGTFATAVGNVNNLSTQLNVVSPTIKVEQGYNESQLPVDDYALNLDCSIENSYRKPTNYTWPTNTATTTTDTPILPPTSASATPTPPNESTAINLDTTSQKQQQQQQQRQNAIQSSSVSLETQNLRIRSTESAARPQSLEQQQQQHQQQQQQQQQQLDLEHHRPSSHNSTVAAAAAAAAVNVSNMPIGGVQGQNPTQGLVHWMSAVMAEHMTGQTHHDPTAVGMHYMWNGNVDCGQHSKEIGDYNGWPPTPRNHMSMKQGYEAKMNEHHHNNLQKGHFLDDNRLDHHAVTPQGNQMAAIYGPSGPIRAVSSNSNSPAGGAGGGVSGIIGGSAGVHPGSHHISHHSSAVAAASAALLVVPQPINASKMSAGLGGGVGGGGTGRKYQCKMCPQIFSSKADLQLHTQIHMREAKPYKCTQCSKAFANSSYLSQHTRIHLGIKPYRCEICQRKFTQLSHLQQHIRTHTGDKPYKCRHPGCQKAFSQLSNLQSHSRCHQTDKPFKCNSCYKCFSDEPSLLEHIPKHKESKHLKTHICQYCGKSYTQETYLTKHMQKHSERTDKRPPILAANASGNNTTGGTGAATSLPAGSTTSASTPGLSGTGGGGGSAAGNSGVSSTNHNRSSLGLPPVSIAPAEHPYWPKVSPDSAANLSDVMHQQQQQHAGQQHHHHQQQQQQHQQHSAQQQQQHSAQQHHQQQHQSQQHMDFPPINQHQVTSAGPGGGGGGGAGSGVGGTSVGPTNGHADLQAHHRMTENGREDIVSTPSTVGPYDAASITKTSSNSAFTPINSMTPHLNTLSHHPMAQRPYLYDAISFQNKNVNQNNANSFPNQLISLHQIRNYAHQPAGLMAGEHLLGVSVGPGKDKG